MSAAAATPATGPGGRIALAFALAAAAASWNPLAAPLGILVGVGAVVLAVRALRRAERRVVPAAALGVSVLAILGGVAVLVFTAGAVSTELPGQPVVQARNATELDRTLSEAAERTRAERERARRELEQAEGGAHGKASPTPSGGPRRAPGGAH